MAKSWRMVNLVTGDATMQRGKMDIAFDDANGRVDELLEPDAILQQRVEKSSIEDQGSNRFALGWGFIGRRLLGAKNAATEIARELGSSLRQMIDALIAEQTRVARRVPLAPEETLTGLRGSKATIELDTIVLEARLGTGDGSTVTARPAFER